MRMFISRTNSLPSMCLPASVDFPSKCERSSVEQLHFLACVSSHYSASFTSHFKLPPGYHAKPTWCECFTACHSQLIIQRQEDTVNARARNLHWVKQPARGSGRNRTQTWDFTCRTIIFICCHRRNPSLAAMFVYLGSTSTCTPAVHLLIKALLCGYLWVCGYL